MSEKSTVGDPIWVESLMNNEEYKIISKRYPQTFTSGSVPLVYSPKYYKDGRWRYKMGAGYSENEIIIINKRIDELREFIIKEKEEADVKNI